MVTVRRIDPVSLAKTYAAVSGVLSLCVALPVGCAFSVIGAAADGGALGAGFGLFALVVYPVMGVVFGFIGGFLFAVVYNLVADRVGGIELELDGYGLDDEAY